MRSVEQVASDMAFGQTIPYDFNWGSNPIETAEKLTNKIWGHFIISGNAESGYFMTKADTKLLAALRHKKPMLKPAITLEEVAIVIARFHHRERELKGDLLDWSLQSDIFKAKYIKLATTACTDKKSTHAFVEPLDSRMSSTPVGGRIRLKPMDDKREQTLNKLCKDGSWRYRWEGNYCYMWRLK